jgi:hypothetical protein
VTFAIANPATAAPDPAGPTKPGSDAAVGTLTVSPNHTITCNHWGGAPYYLGSGTDMAVNAYWQCSDYVDVRSFCARTQLWDPVDKSWFYNNFQSTCTNSTAPSGAIIAYGVCGGSPGAWTRKYRVHEEFQEFHGTWLIGSYDSTPGTLNC